MGHYTDDDGDEEVETCECEATVEVGTVTASPPGGTHYGPHGYHLWGSEGCVVAKTGSLSYIRLGKITFAFPIPIASALLTPPPFNVKRETSRSFWR